MSTTDKGSAQTKHTQGKLEVQKMSPHHPGDSRMVVVRIVNSPVNNSLAAIGSDNYPESEANANRLALCWNSHDDLLAAAENILSNLDDDKTLKRRSRDQLIFKSSVIRQLLQSAIANVKGA